MELNTFGAVLRFALSLEQEGAQRLDQAARLAGDRELKTLLTELAREGAKFRRRLERVRREQVNEMLLEPIGGLESRNYPIESVPPAGSADGDLAGMARQLEAIAARFYQDASKRLSIPDVTRSFGKLAQAHAAREARLAELAAP